MDIQQQLIDLANEKSRLTSEDKILLDAMKTLGEFVKEIDDGVNKENFDDNDFSVDVGSHIVKLKIGDKQLFFLRRSENIEVTRQIIGETKYIDDLLIKNHKVVSEKHNIELSNELFAKYSEFFF